jgi:tetraacyldisaccharide 4'-kinase
VTAKSSLASAYGWVTRVRAFLYLRGFLKRRTLGHPVVSVGNLTVGGSGKTPMVVYLADLLGREGFAPAVLSRGYKGKAESTNLLVSDGKRVFAGVEDAGDEPIMMARRLPGVPVAVGADRWASGRLIENRLPHDRRVFLLDDGFQHLRLARNVDLLLMDATQPILDGKPMPAGWMREPHSAAARAHAFLVTRSHQARLRLKWIDGELHKIVPHLPIFHFEHAIEGFFELASGRSVPEEELAGKQVVALAALGNPGQFVNDLGRAGVRVVNEFLFRDHHPYIQPEVDRVLEVAEKLSTDTIVTTEKDLPRLEGLDLTRGRFLFARLRLECRGEEEFPRWLLSRLRGDRSGEAGT